MTCAAGDVHAAGVIFAADRAIQRPIDRRAGDLQLQTVVAAVVVQTAGLAFQRSTVDRDVRVVGKVRNRIITADLRGALDCISSVIFA